MYSEKKGNDPGKAAEATSQKAISASIDADDTEAKLELELDLYAGSMCPCPMSIEMAPGSKEVCIEITPVGPEEFWVGGVSSYTPCNQVEVVWAGSKDVNHLRCSIDACVFGIHDGFFSPVEWGHASADNPFQIIIRAVGSPSVLPIFRWALWGKRRLATGQLVETTTSMNVTARISS